MNTKQRVHADVPQEKADNKRFARTKAAESERRPIVWALCDGRPGNDNQTKGVAYATGGEVKEIPISMNPAVVFAKHGFIPSWTAPDDASKGRLKLAPVPDIIIATGGRLAPVAHYAKKQYAPYALRAHIMVPPHITSDIDLLIHPLHDVIKRVPRHIKTLRLAGSPNNVSALLKKKGAKLRADLRIKAAIPEHAYVMGVCIGGVVKGADVPGIAEAQLLRLYLDKAIDKGFADYIIITASRRTPSAFVDYLRRYVPNAFFTNDVNDVLYNASIYGLYAASDALCVTSDSVNMCSESCSTGKPVFLARFLQCMKKKHIMFSEYLLTEGYADDMSVFTGHGAPVLFSRDRTLEDTELAADIINKLL